MSAGAKYCVTLASVVFVVLLNADLAAFSDPGTEDPEKRLETLRALVRSARTQEAAATATAAGLDLADELIDENHFSLASRAAVISRNAATKTGQRFFLNLTTYYDKFARSLHSEFAALEEHLAALEQDPNDETAALEVGLFHCFHKGDWNTGLPLLERAADSRLASLAKADAQSPASAEEQLKLGDMWGEYATDAPGKVRNAIQQRAKHWYLKALPQLKAPERAALVKRITRVRSKPFQLKIVARIEGADLLTITGERLAWQNRSFGYPPSLAVNGMPWDLKQQNILLNKGATRLLPHRLHITTARLEKKRGRGPIRMTLDGDSVRLAFDDNAPPGSSVYEATVTFDSY